MKQIYSRRELVEMGYPDTELKLLARSEDAHKFGFHGTRGNGISNKFFFNKEKLDKYLEWREKIR